MNTSQDKYGTRSMFANSAVIQNHPSVPTIASTFGLLQPPSITQRPVMVSSPLVPSTPDNIEFGGDSQAIGIPLWKCPTPWGSLKRIYYTNATPPSSEKLRSIAQKSDVFVALLNKLNEETVCESFEKNNIKTITINHNGNDIVYDAKEFLSRTVCNILYGFHLEDNDYPIPEKNPFYQLLFISNTIQSFRTSNHNASLSLLNGWLHFYNILAVICSDILLPIDICISFINPPHNPLHEFISCFKDTFQDRELLISKDNGTISFIENILCLSNSNDETIYGFMNQTNIRRTSCAVACNPDDSQSEFSQFGVSENENIKVLECSFDNWTRLLDPIWLEELVGGLADMVQEYVSMFYQFIQFLLDKSARNDNNALYYQRVFVSNTVVFSFYNPSYVLPTAFHVAIKEYITDLLAIFCYRKIAPDDDDQEDAKSYIKSFLINRVWSVYHLSYDQSGSMTELPRFGIAITTDDDEHGIIEEAIPFIQQNIFDNIIDDLIPKIYEITNDCRLEFEFDVIDSNQDPGWLKIESELGHRIPDQSILEKRHYFAILDNALLEHSQQLVDIFNPHPEIISFDNNSDETSQIFGLITNSLAVYDFYSLYFLLAENLSVHQKISVLTNLPENFKNENYLIEYVSAMMTEEMYSQENFAMWLVSLINKCKRVLGLEFIQFGFSNIWTNENGSSKEVYDILLQFLSEVFNK